MLCVQHVASYIYFKYISGICTTCVQTWVNMHIYVSNIIAGIFFPSQREVSSTLLLSPLSQNSWRYLIPKVRYVTEQCFKSFLKSEHTQMFLSNLVFCYRRKDLGQHFASSSAYWAASVLCPCSPWCRCAERSLINISFRCRLLFFGLKNITVPLH